MDASKAFDRVNHWLLFKKLIDRGMPLIFVRILMEWYTVVPATSGHLRFGAKVAPRGRWPLVAGNGNS